VALDQQIGRVLDKLDGMGIAGDTIVVYAGDNGYFWGEHRLVDKRWPYEESIRIPFIVRYPRLIKDPGRKAEQMVLNIDLAPTLLGVAGVPLPGNIEGQSFEPVLLSGTAPGRKAWLYEYFKEFPYNVPEHKTVRTETHIYIDYAGQRRSELYDLVNDPRQMHNLIDSSEGKLMVPELKKMLNDLNEGKRL
jgi:N-acetylglucosamine-6-sulfatase